MRLIGSPSLILDKYITSASSNIWQCSTQTSPYSWSEVHSSKQLESHYIHKPNWKMPAEQTTFLYGSLQSELKTTHGPWRESFKAGFYHKKFAELLFCLSRMPPKHDAQCGFAGNFSQGVSPLLKLN